MRSPVPALTPLLRSNTQGDILALLYVDPSRELTLAEIQRATGANTSVVHREIERLASAGIIAERRVGRNRLVRSNPDYELAKPLSEIIIRTYGPLPLLSQLLGAIDGVAEAYIYGSWAARYSGELGAFPGDIDVLVVGSPRRALLDQAARHVAVTIGREVNVTRVAESEWRLGNTPFLRTVRQRPLVNIPLERDGT
ncbi:ArsR family transcriptional regulator [soil metagenome]